MSDASCGSLSGQGASGYKLSDHMGRVIVPLARLVSGASYDFWLPLHVGSRFRRAGKHARVRLRLCATFRDERTRLLEYPCDTPRTFVIPFCDKATLRDAKLARHGIESDATYSWDKLIGHRDVRALRAAQTPLSTRPPRACCLRANTVATAVCPVALLLSSRQC